MKLTIEICKRIIAVDKERQEILRGEPETWGEMVAKCDAYLSGVSDGIKRAQEIRDSVMGEKP